MLLLERVGERAQAGLVEAGDAAGDQRGAVRASTRVGRRGRRSPPIAAFTFASCSSRVSRLTSACSRSIASGACAALGARARATTRSSARLQRAVVVVGAGAGHRLDAADAGGDAALGRDREQPDVAGGGQCVPPHSSRLKPGIETTRTVSPYFSPKSAIAPAAIASAVGFTSVVDRRCCAGSRR